MSPLNTSKMDRKAHKQVSVIKVIIKKCNVNVKIKNGVVQWLVDASSVAASGCHRWLALLGERVSKMCKSHLAST